MFMEGYANLYGTSKREGSATSSAINGSINLYLAKDTLVSNIRAVIVVKCLERCLMVDR